MRQRLFLPNSFFKGLLPLPQTFVLYVLSGAGPSYLVSTTTRKRRFRSVEAFQDLSSSNSLERNANPDIYVGFRAKCIRAAKKLDCRMNFAAFLVCL